METANKLFYSGTKFFTENEEDYRITVRISLDDDCKNNLCALAELCNEHIIQ